MAIDDESHIVYGLEVIEIASGKREVNINTAPLYRLAGRGKDICLFVNSSFTPYSASIPGFEINEISLPKEIENTNQAFAICFYPLGETKYIAEFSQIIDGQSVKNYYEYSCV